MLLRLDLELFQFCVGNTVNKKLAVTSCELYVVHLPSDHQKTELMNWVIKPNSE